MDCVKYILVAFSLFALLGCRGAYAEPRFEVSVILDTDTDRATVDRVIADAAQIYKDQLGIEIVAILYSTDHIADHTHADALLNEVVSYRLANMDHLYADATVLFTRRRMTRMVEGVATIGPPCSMRASAVIGLRDDGLDGYTLAHELAHTVGAKHDELPGYLMSDTKIRIATPQFSPETIDVFKTSNLGCMRNETTQTPSVQVAPAPTVEVTGGGGAFSTIDAVFSVMLALIVWLIRMHVVTTKINKSWHNKLIAVEMQLASRTPKPDTLRNIASVRVRASGDNERVLVMEFQDYAHLIDHHRWIQAEIKRAQNEKP